MIKHDESRVRELNMLVKNYKDFKKLNLDGLSIRLIELYDVTEMNLASVACDRLKFKDENLNITVENFEMVIDNDIMEEIVNILDKLVISDKHDTSIDVLARRLCVLLVDYTVKETRLKLEEAGWLLLDMREEDKNE